MNEENQKESKQDPIETSGSFPLQSGVSLDIQGWNEGIKIGASPEEDCVTYRSYKICCNKCFMSVDIPPFLWGVDVVTIECSNCGNKWEQERG